MWDRITVTALCFFPSSCCKFTLTISCSPCLADGADPSVNISLICAKANLSCSFPLLSSSVTSCAQVYLTLHTLPVFLLYTDMQEIGTAILLLSRSWGLEPQALLWKRTGGGVYPGLIPKGDLVSQKATVALSWLFGSPVSLKRKMMCRRLHIT